MNLIVFDIDGTVVDSVKHDDECFIECFKDLHGIDLSGVDWNDFKHVTDAGLTNEIFQIHFGREPSAGEVIELKNYFLGLLKDHVNDFTEIKGAKNIVNTLIEHTDFSIAFATGGWKETALLKLHAIGLEIGEITLVSSNEHFDRTQITKMAIENALAKADVRNFETITYVGDGLWDFNTTKALRINFIGIDARKNRKLIKAGVEKVMGDLEDSAKFISWAKDPG